MRSDRIVEMITKECQLEGKKAHETAVRYIKQQNNQSVIDIIFMEKIV